MPTARRITDNLEQRAVEEGWQLLPISVRHAQLAGSWGVAHPDPFDRLLAAQARLENLDLVTADRAFGGFGTSCVW